MPTIDSIDALAHFWDDDDPVPEKHQVLYKPFRPQLNPVQGDCYDAIRIHLYNLLHGPRFSGKTVGGVHALIEHCRENFNARAIIIVLTGRQGEEGGVWHKLNHTALPEWRDGCGIAFTEPKTNKYKDLFIWISNRYGSWSKVVMLSMPFEGFVADRIKGMEPTFILVDEAQTLQSDTYFSSIVQQLGRDVKIKHQPIVYCCNPDGPSHWLYKRFFIYPVDDKTGKWNKDYFVKAVPLSDNARHVPEAYIRRLIETTRNNDTEYRRMVLGEWVDAPEGDAIFREDFNETLHMRGNFIKNEGILPVKGIPIVGSWDLGAAHSSIHFQQCVATKDKMFWPVFDELNYVDQYMPYWRLVPKLIQRMQYWCERIGTPFQFMHISDDSAFNQFRATTGSFDHLDVRNLSRDYVMKNNLEDRFVINMLAAPKGAHSVETRVRAEKERLQQGERLVSAMCYKTKEMYLRLEEDKDNRMKPKRSRFLHPFDSVTYAPHFFNSRGRVPRLEVGEVQPQTYKIGG